MLVAPTLILFAYHFFSLLTDECSLLLRIAVAEHYVYALMSLCLSALLGGPADVTNDFGGATALPESGVLLPWSSAVQTFISDV